MDNVIIKKINMNWAVKQFELDNATSLNPLPNYPTLQTEHITNFNLFLNLSETYQYTRTGSTVTKSQLRSSLITILIDNTSRIAAFASNTNNQALLAEVSYSDSEYEKMDAVTLRNSSQGIYDRIQSNISSLAIYGITSTTQTALLNAITAYVSYIPKTSSIISDRKNLREQLFEQSKKTDATLEKLDFVLKILKIQNPIVYKSYQNSRKLKPIPTSILSLRAKVIDELTQLPISGVKVEIQMIDNIEGKDMIDTNIITKTTSKKGAFQCNSLAAGTYQLTAKKNGLKIEVITTSINNGERTDILIKMNKA